MDEDTSSGATERVARTFPLFDWVLLARRFGDGKPLPEGVDWEAYTVELIERLMPVQRITSTEDIRPIPRVLLPSSYFTSEPPENEGVQDPDGAVDQREIHGDRAWYHVRTAITHPEVTARLEWEWDGSTLGRIAIAGLEEDADPERSCRILLKAIQLLRDYEWRGRAKAGRPELSDDDVRHDLEVALEECRRNGGEHPTVRQLAEAHERRNDPYAEIEGLSERALRDRMRKHPGPFRDLAPWIRLPKKR